MAFITYFLVLSRVLLITRQQNFSPQKQVTLPEQPTRFHGDYMTLHPSTRSWEISRKQIDIIKNIGKGAFSQVAKATVKNINDQEVITVAVKMLKGYGKLLAFFLPELLLFDWID